MRSRLILALCLSLAGAAEAQDLNVISSVEVKEAGGTVLVTVKGSKPPNFTTFSMADPARFVIDLSEARFQGVPEDMRIDDGVIRVVKNLAYGSGASAIARVMIAFSLDVEPPDVQTDGNTLAVRVTKPGGAAVAATGAGTGGSPVSAPAAGAVAEAGVPGATVAAAAAVAAADEAARQEALARQQREAEAREQARVAAETTAKEREAQARVEAEARAREAEKLAAQQAAADEAARAAAEARSAEIKAKAAAEGAQPQKLKEEPPEFAAAVTAVAAAPAPQDAAAKAEAERAARAQAKADAKAKREVEAALATEQSSESRLAAATPAPAPAPISAAAAAATARSTLAASLPPSRPAKLQAIGFTQLATVSRVFVRTSTPPRFTISDVGDDVVRLEVENTRAPRRNDTRALDTSFFPSAVAMITPSKRGSSYVVDIKLKKRVPYQQKVEGDVVAIDFERPAGEPGAGEAVTPAAAATPAAGAPAEEMLENAQGLVVSPDEKAEGAEPAGDPEPAPKQ